LPYLPLYVRLQWVVARPGVRDLHLDPGGRHRLDRVWIAAPPQPAPPAPTAPPAAVPVPVPPPAAPPPPAPAPAPPTAPARPADPGAADAPRRGGGPAAAGGSHRPAPGHAGRESMRSTAIARLTAIGLVALGLLAAAPATGPKRGGTYRAVLGADPPTLDPAQ